MKPAPIQLLQLLFKKVSVQIDERHAPREPNNPFTTVFVFDGVDISTVFGIGEIDPDHERGRLFLVTLQVMVDNQPSDQALERKFCPYLIDVEVRGVVLVRKGAEKLAPPEDLAAVNGASLLWSAVREQVLTVTSRMLAGPVTLPTMNFHDLKQGTPAVEPDVPAAKPKASRRKKTGNADPT
ncbi:MAG: hypothetical protein F9K25_15065 [Candidatus Contendobacter sp.]|nr:MAG: hypothetical protein F9K25_15065 [Candidatus Contendobacter sp.]